MKKEVRDIHWNSVFITDEKMMVVKFTDHEYCNGLSVLWINNFDYSKMKESPNKFKSFIGNSV